jgi:hypothetical protein
MENESLRRLCEQAAKEPDPMLLMALVREIIDQCDASRSPNSDEAPKGVHAIDAMSR